MQSGQAKMRGFGRCPYCRAMIYQDPKAVIYYCSKCRTPIRGKNPEPTDDTEYALSQLEILSADTASMLSDEPEPSNPKHSVAEDDDELRPWLSGSTRCRETGASSSSYRAFGSVRVRAGPRSSGLNGLDRDEQTGAGRSGSPLHSRVSELRPSSRRTRRPLSGDMDVLRDEGSSTGSESDVPTSASSYRRRASPLSSQELDASMDLSGHEPTGVARSPLTDPAFQKDLLQALDNLRKVIAAVEQPRGIDEHRHARMPPRTSASCNESGSAHTATRRNSRLMRRLESQLVHALPADGPRRDGSTSSSSSTSSGRRGGERRRAWRHHCRPILGGTPFVVCDKCSEILQLPVALSVDSTARVQCGGCGEPLALILPASGGSTDRPKKIFSAPQPAVSGADDADEHALARSSLSGEQRRPAEGPLHRVLGYSSVSSVLRSRRYED